LVLRAPTAVSEAGKQRHISQNLARLFEACGEQLQIDYSGRIAAAGIDKTSQQSQESVSSLREFVREHARPEALQRMQMRRSLNRSAEISSTIVRLQSGSGLLFSPENMPLKEKWRGLELLRQHMEDMGPYERVRLQDVIFVVVQTGSGCSVSPLGYVLLDITRPDDWYSFLRYGDFDGARLAAHERRKRSEREAALARLLDISHVMADDNIATTAEYADLLERLERSHGDEWKLQEKSEHITLQAVSAKGPPTPFTIHAIGALHIPVTAAVWEIVDFINESSREARARTERHNQLNQAEYDAMLDCKRTFQLLSLERAPETTQHQMFHCCTRLLAFRRELQPLLRGLAIRVSDNYTVDGEDGTLYIKWNWL